VEKAKGNNPSWFYRFARSGEQKAGSEEERRGANGEAKRRKSGILSLPSVVRTLIRFSKSHFR
jgi:hypothetical protein